jgi:hypothetical protein
MLQLALFNNLQVVGTKTATAACGRQAGRQRISQRPQLMYRDRDRHFPIDTPSLYLLQGLQRRTCCFKQAVTAGGCTLLLQAVLPAVLTFT